jgi:hypothetical protein
MFDFESKEQPATKFWVTDDGYFCIEQESREFGKPVTFLLGPDAVELLAANIEAVSEAQRKNW